MTISSTILDIFTRLFAGRAEDVRRSLSNCNEINRQDVKSTTALGQGLDDEDSS